MRRRVSGVKISSKAGLEWLFGTVSEQHTGLSKRAEGELADYHEEKKQAAFARKMRVMKQLVQRAFVPEEGEKSECLDHDEGMKFKFIADELSMVVSEIPAAAVAVGRACGFQRMALQVARDLKSPSRRSARRTRHGAGRRSWRRLPYGLKKQTRGVAHTELLRAG
jgi:hypothetical protein